MATFFKVSEELPRREGAPSGAERRRGWWRPGSVVPWTDRRGFREALGSVRQEQFLVDTPGGLAVGLGGTLGFEDSPHRDALPVVAWVPATVPEQLGDASFVEDHGLRYPYLAGAMANGIGSVEIVSEMARAGMLGFFGAAGLSLEAIEAALDRLQRELGDRPWGSNLIHSPAEPELEDAVVDLYLRRGVRRVEASAYMELTPAIVRYRVTGLRRGPDGTVHSPHRIVAKASRSEVAARFLSPPPERILADLVTRGRVRREEAELAAEIPMAQDLTVEADSGGHTDNRPAIALVPALLALRDRLQAKYRYATPLRVGAAGGVATPASAAAAFAMGAAYVLTGSINQGCVESGSSDVVRAMLAEAESADVTMAPAADMFELGVKVQVLKRGTMFPMRATRLYEIYKAAAGLDAISAADRALLEKTFFRSTFDEVWRETQSFFARRDPGQLDRAATDPKHKMALVFRWYLGCSSRWANSGEPTRKLDYQVWCGPAMGAFNEWTRGSFLEQPGNRRVATVALNILHGAALTLRASNLRAQGVRLPEDVLRPAPLTLEELHGSLQ